MANSTLPAILVRLSDPGRADTVFDRYGSPGREIPALGEKLMAAARK